MVVNLQYAVALAAMALVERMSSSSEVMVDAIFWFSKGCKYNSRCWIQVGGSGM